MTTLIIALAPVLIVLVYIYFRDKYEKEPIGMLLWGLLAGALILHGLYNFMLLSGHPLLLLLFIPFLVFLWRSGSKRLRKLSAGTVVDHPEQNDTNPSN